MDLAWGMALGLMFGGMIGFMTCALLTAAKRADEIAEMMRIMEDFRKPEVTE